MNRLKTSHGKIAVAESQGKGPPVLLIHGNSLSKEIFRKQLEGEPGEKYRLIAMDLPGHGNSDNAKDPEGSYRIPGYAESALETLEALGIKQAPVLGYSLGGHVAIEMMARFSGLTGAFIFGAPPFKKGEEGMGEAFLPSEAMDYIFKEELTEEEIVKYIRSIFGENNSGLDFLPDTIRRTDGVARRLMFEAALRGDGVDQKDTVCSSPVPLAVVAGSDDNFINNDYLQSVKYKNLWDGKVHILEGIGHAPHWEAPEPFNKLLLRFLDSLF